MIEGVVGAVIALLTGLVGVLVLIPGEQGETFLKRIIEILKRFIGK